MSALTVTDVFNRVKRAFGDESAVQLTEDDIIRGINDAQREAVMQNEGLLPIVSYLDLVSGNRYYDIPENIFTVHHVYCLGSAGGSYFKLKWLNIYKFSEFVDGWDGDTWVALPRVYSKETNQIIVFPAPDMNLTNGIKIHASRYAVPVENPADEIDLPPFLHTMVVNHCLAQAYEMDEDWEASQIKSQQVQGDLNFNSSRDDWFGRDKFPVVTDQEEDVYY